MICFLSGAFFSEAALLAAVYVLFLAFAFHGPSHWEGNQAEFGFFVDHFTFIAGLLFAAVKGRADCWRCATASFSDPDRPTTISSARRREGRLVGAGLEPEQQLVAEIEHRPFDHRRIGEDQ